MNFNSSCFLNSIRHFTFFWSNLKPTEKFLLQRTFFPVSYMSLISCHIISKYFHVYFLENRVHSLIKLQCNHQIRKLILIYHFYLIFRSHSCFASFVNTVHYNQQFRTKFCVWLSYLFLVSLSATILSFLDFCDLTLEDYSPVIL